MYEIQNLMNALYRYFPVPEEERRKGAAHWVSYSECTYTFKLWLGPENTGAEFGIGDGYSGFETIPVLQQMVKRERHPTAPFRFWSDLTGGEQALLLSTLSDHPTEQELFDARIWPGDWLREHRSVSENEIRRLVDEVAELGKKHE